MVALILPLNIPSLNITRSKSVEGSQKYKKPDETEADKYIIVNQPKDVEVSDLVPNLYNLKQEGKPDFAATPDDFPKIIKIDK